jgi:FKBP-type peptidyl-prolyl cis-trans isomerase
MTLLHQKQQLGRWLAQALFMLAVLVSFASCKQEQDPFRNPCVATEEEKMAQKEIDVKIIKKYFRDNDIDTTNMLVTDSGIHYFKIKENGSGEEIKSGDRVSVHYIGKFINKSTFEESTTFDNSYPRGTPFTVCVDAKNTTCSVIEGWNQALKVMRTGEIYRFYIPSYIAYGRCGSQNIMPNEVLSFEIETLRKF